MSPRWPIEAHGLVGDGRAAALIAADGTIDWLCWPRFDSDPTLGALLHDGSAGQWELRPEGEWAHSQRYVPDTNVLQTHFVRPGGALRITDAMPVASQQERRRRLIADHELLRVVECLEGNAEVNFRLRLAPGFGTERIVRSDRGPLGLCAETRRGAFFLRGERTLRWAGNEVVAHFRIKAGERVRFSLGWTSEAPAVLAPLGERADAALEDTVRFWRGWAARARYQGPHREAVVRSALVLKLLQYPPSGAFLAAATTSLPERLGGALNWDYRFCWLRDAAFTSRCLYQLGYPEEADAFVEWLLHATRLTQPRLSVLYDVFGNRPRPEREVPEISGYGGSRPVRLGNAADVQLQLDLQGEVIDAVYSRVKYARAPVELDAETQHLLRGFGREVARHWRLPDASLWEYRSAPEHHTHSKVLCWVALDRLLELHRLGALQLHDVAGMAQAREDLDCAIRVHGVHPDTGAFVGVFGGTEPDVALLLLPWYGFEPASSPRMRATLASVRSSLEGPGGLLYRNRRLREEGDGAFVSASFWAVGVVAEGAGPLALAEQWFEALAQLGGPLGLLPEEWDPGAGAGLGNYPQAYSHVGLISAALDLQARAARDRSTFTQAPWRAPALEPEPAPEAHP